ncbi:MAG: bifunctional diaminohydroxyphosphoribosylaminopyrimidine deaminase/5-amino-6-(5-phosphoribosylamino)uracil reductase RibD [Desulfobulbus sp.]|nr:bifunctional diaminohydroxyphosphoribosylaminopyrimidine deaminase/5-amino-6-(5-phosphoribosylamino)uracil reductase RibD [Desulfobulbus sp.]
MQHEQYMRLALNEAEKGLGRTTPNPAVGAVIVNSGQVVGRGYHKKAGTAHAEVNAIHAAGEAAGGGTLYVTLEPCNHTGRTPPCTQAILKAGLTRVVIGTMDPNPTVVGGGADFLREQGVEVVCGVLEEQCRDLINPFVKHSSTGLPWVIIKAGLSLDGKIAFCQGKGGAITGSDSSHSVHQLRDQVDAILVGVGTALIDDPSLTTRLEGKDDTRDPLRIVLDSQLRLPPRAQMLTQHSSAQTWIFCADDADVERERALLQSGAVVHRLPPAADGRPDLKQLLAFLGAQQLNSLLVEGGAAIHGAFWWQKLVDELRLYYAPYFIGDHGVPLLRGFALDKRPAESPMSRITFEQNGDDFLLRALLAR